MDANVINASKQCLRENWVLTEAQDFYFYFILGGTPVKTHGSAREQCIEDNRRSSNYLTACSFACLSPSDQQRETESK